MKWDDILRAIDWKSKVSSQNTDKIPLTHHPVVPETLPLRKAVVPTVWSFILSTPPLGRLLNDYRKLRLQADFTCARTAVAEWGVDPVRWASGREEVSCLLPVPGTTGPQGPLEEWQTSGWMARSCFAAGSGPLLLSSGSLCITKLLSSPISRRPPDPLSALAGPGGRRLVSFSSLE